MKGDCQIKRAERSERALKIPAHKLKLDQSIAWIGMGMELSDKRGRGASNAQQGKRKTH